MGTAFVALIMPVTTLVTLPVLFSPAEAATTNNLSVNVVVARDESRAPGGPVSKGDPIPNFRWMVNVDDTGTTDQRNPAPGSGCAATDPGYPANCRWQSIDEPSGWAPIYAQGNQDDLPLLNVPDGRYLISVLSDGFKIDGAHFCVDNAPPAEPGCVNPIAGPVTVSMQPDPLPDATLRGHVFEDNAQTNGTLDANEAPLAGFQAQVNDTLGEISTDVYGNPLCTTYIGENPDTHVIDPNELDADGVPVVDKIGGKCLSDNTGMLTVPHLGTNRYTLSAVPPQGAKWIQTTTLEGNHDYDAWMIEGDTGFDQTFTHGGEPIPLPIFGYVQELHNHAPLDGSAAGHIKGSVVGIKTYTPPKGGDFDFWGGNTGTKVGAAIDKPWLSLTDLQLGDQAVWIGQGNPDGTFDISGVPDGDYNLTWWDEPQDYNVNFINVTVSNGQTVNMGKLPLNGWWTVFDGYVFNDTNRNGVKDPGEKGIPNFTLTMRQRQNTLLDRGTPTAVTDADGYYKFDNGYPWGEWLVEEAYNDSYYTTGVTYQADNQPQPTTIKGAGVDVSVLPIIGLSGRMDWGVHAYDPTGSNGIDPQNGGIVGTVSYDTTRNELDPQFAATEDWQPGISGVPVELYDTVPCGTNVGTACDANDQYELASDGSYARGPLLNTYLSESWQRPQGCTARDVDGNPLVHMADNPSNYDENVLVPNQETDGECISSFMQGIQYGPYPTDQGTPDANFGAAVNGNYGFGDGCFNGTLDATDVENPICVGGDFTPLGSGDYLVHIAIPDDATGNPMYDVTQEEDINIARGDQIIPQVPPPACAGALHTVDLANDGTDNYPPVVGDGGVTNDVPAGVTVPASTPVENPPFVDMGGTPYEGMPKPMCDTKLVRVNNGKSIVPIFNIFTDVPVPARLRAVIIDDLQFTNDPRSIMFGEKKGLAFAPVGFYDFNNKLEYTAETDFNGIYDVLMPSTDHISCPTPSGVCANMYRVVANDPGIPGQLNPNYNPRFATHAAGGEAIPGMMTFADLAPTQVGLTVESPSTGVSQAITCPLEPTTPQLLAVSQPYVNGSGSFNIQGTGFGATKGNGKVTLDGTTVLPTTSWNNTSIDVTVPAGTAVGAHQLEITGDNGQTTVNGLTFHVRGGSYMPNLYEVGPTKTYHLIQDALDAALASPGNDLVVVYPGAPDPSNPRINPRGEYYENLIMASPVKLQGVGPGGFQGTTYVPGSGIDASAFGTDNDVATAWYNKVGALTWSGNQNVNDGAGIYVLASENSTNAANTARQFTNTFKASIDGFDIRGGRQDGFPGNINDLTGGSTGLPPTIVTQGGAIFANAYARNLQITNNVVQNNASGYGTIRIGTPDLAAPDTNQHNENVRIADNRIITNGGTNLAGGIGLYAGSDNYEVTQNDICGNFSLEYGGGMTVYGRSPNGKIHHNRVYYNMSNDEGGGIMIAGQLAATPSDLSPGSGPVDIYANQIQANLANDDGGGIRFLMAAGGPNGMDPMNVYNNTITNNVSTHEGGGVSLNDAPNVRVYNNTIVKNLTTATAVTSNGLPAPAGLSSSANSDLLQAVLPGGSPTFSKPLLFNNIFWDNRAGTRAGLTVHGIGIAGDPTPIDEWDLGVADRTDALTPTDSVIQQDPNGLHNYAADPSNSNVDPGFAGPAYDLSVSFSTWRQNPAFVDATLVTSEVPPNLMGNYHLGACPGSSACNKGAASSGGVNAPATDIDNQARPALGGFDAGSDEWYATVTPPPPPSTSDLYFSTVGNTNPPGVTGAADDADLYKWNGSVFSREWDATAFGLPASANVDGFSRVDATHFYMSFTGTVNVPGLGNVQDEDVVYNNAGTWSMFFDGSTHGVGGAVDIGATSVVGTTLYFSTNNAAVPPGAGAATSGDNSDVYRWNGGNSFTRMVDASAAPFNLPNSGSFTGTTNPNVDGLIYVDPTHFYMSFSNTNTTVPGLGSVQDEDVLYFNGSAWTVSFDGTSHGLTSDNLDIDAISFASGALAPPPPPPPPPAVPLYFSTSGSTNPPGVGGTADNSDIYYWSGATFTRQVDATTLGVPASANVDGFDRVDNTHFYMSFSNANTALPGLGNVQDEDVVYYNNGVWSVYFDGTAHGMTAANQDLDAISIISGTLYFSTLGNTNPAGVSGTADDADIYSWNGTSYARVWDATANGFAAAANTDGFVRVDATHFYLSFSLPNTAVPVIGNVQDEDVVYYDGSGWSVYFDGTINGLNSGNLDVDAFDVP